MENKENMFEKERPYDLKQYKPELKFRAMLERGVPADEANIIISQQKAEVEDVLSSLE